LREGHVVQARLGHANSGSRDRTRVAFYAHHLSGRTNKSGRQHCYVANAGTKIQDALAWANARFTKEAFGERGQKRRLPNQALVFGVGAAQRVVGGGTTR
jgi:hypothetical protein